MRDEVFAEALAKIRSSGATIYERNRTDLTSQSHQLECVSAAWYLNEIGNNHDEALHKSIRGLEKAGVPDRCLIIPNLGTDWLVREEIPIKKLDNKTILLEKGVVISAKDGFFPRPQDRTTSNVTGIFLISDVANLVLHGESTDNDGLRPRVVMFRDGDNDARWGEGHKTQRWDVSYRNGIRIVGALRGDLTIRNFDIRRCAGDGIYMRAGGAHHTKIHNMHVSENMRNNLTFTDCRRVTVTNSRFDRAWIKWGVGLDIEPDKSGTIEDLTVRDCNFDNNPHAGITMGLEAASYEPLHKVRIERCLIRALSSRFAEPMHGVRVGTFPVRAGGGGQLEEMQALFILDQVTVRGANGFPFYIYGPQSPQATIEMNYCIQQEADDVTPVRRPQIGCVIFDVNAALIVNGHNGNSSHNASPQPVNSQITIRGTVYHGINGKTLKRPLYREDFTSALCQSQRSGAVTSNGTELVLQAQGYEKDPSDKCKETQDE